MTIKLNAPQSQMEGLAVNAVKLVTAVAVFLVLMTTVICSVARVRAVSKGREGALARGPHTVLPGSLRPSLSTSLLVDFPVEIERIAVRPGDTVEAGQLLALLSSPDVTLAAERARARLTRAEERLAAIRRQGGEDLAAQIRRAEYDAAEVNLAAARQRLESFDGDGFRQAYQDARDRTAQMRRLLDKRLVTSAELAQSLRAEQEALRSLQSSSEHHSRLLQESAEAESRLRIARMRFERNEATEAHAARREHDEAKIDLELAERRLEDLQVIAPRSATILSVNVSEGDRVVSGAPLIHLSDLSTLAAEVPVSASVARQIAVGTPVEVRVPTDPPRELPSAVESVLLVPDARSQGYLVRVRIPNPDPGVILAGLDCAVVFPHMDTGETWLERLF